MTATLSHDPAVEEGEPERWWASPACEALSGAVDVLAGAGVPVSDAELGGDLIGVRREINRLEAMFCERAGVFDARRGYAVDGAVSAAWVSYTHLRAHEAWLHLGWRVVGVKKCLGGVGAARGAAGCR